jgi:hypothetical protein
MDDGPRRFARALPWLAAILGVEGLVALGLVFSNGEYSHSTCFGALIHVPEAAVLLGFGLAVRIMTTGGPTRIACQRLLYGGFASIAVAAIARYVDVDVLMGTSIVWLFLHAGSTMLFAVAAAGLWGVALAREQDLSSERITRVGRIFAGGAFAGAGLFALSEVAVLFRFPRLWGRPAAMLGVMAATVVLLAGRALLLWCAWDLWKPASDEGVARDRARAVHKRMILASALALSSALFTGFFWGDEAPEFPYWVTNPPMILWYGFVQLTLTVLVTILLAIALENESLSYTPRMKGSRFPEPPPPPPSDLGPIDVP